MPPSASRKRPRRARSAPVKAPRAWPKSSLSSSVSGIAPQFTATNDSLRRGDCAWIARASTSLPVPLSPVRSTVALYSAARSISSSTSIMIGDAATIGRSPATRSTSRASSSRLAPQPLAFLRLAEGEQQLGGLEGLREVVVGAAAHRLEREFLGAIRGHQDQRGVGTPPRQLRQQRETVDAGHAQIAEHDVGHRVLDPRQRIGAIAREARLVAFRAQHERQALPERLVVVHDQDPLRQEASTRCVSAPGRAGMRVAGGRGGTRGIRHLRPQVGSGPDRNMTSGALYSTGVGISVGSSGGGLRGAQQRPALPRGADDEQGRAGP